MGETKQEYAYIGIKGCGCVVAATIDMPEHKKDVSRAVAKFIKDGMTIERVTVEEARNLLSVCACSQVHTAKQQGDLL